MIDFSLASYDFMSLLGHKCDEEKNCLYYIKPEIYQPNLILYKTGKKGVVNTYLLSMYCAHSHLPWRVMNTKDTLLRNLMKMLVNVTFSGFNMVNLRKCWWIPRYGMFDLQTINVLSLSAATSMSMPEKQFVTQNAIHTNLVV